MRVLRTLCSKKDNKISRFITITEYDHRFVYLLQVPPEVYEPLTNPSVNKITVSRRPGSG